MANPKPTAHLPCLQPSPRRAGAAAAYALWWISDSVDFSGECWIWRGATSEKGYGVLHLKNYDLPQSTVQVHRVVYEICVEPIPDGLCILHRCDNPPCCRPGHLFLGANLDNVADKVGKGRQAKGQAVRRNHDHLKGEAIKTARLTAEDVLAIRRADAEGESPASIAARYGTSDTQVRTIVDGKSWAHLPFVRRANRYRRDCPKCGVTLSTRQGAFYRHVASCGNATLGKE